jgi:hypothetical protein
MRIGKIDIPANVRPVSPKPARFAVVSRHPDDSVGLEIVQSAIQWMPNRSHRFVSTFGSCSIAFPSGLPMPDQSNLCTAASDSTSHHGAREFEELRTFGWVGRFAPVKGVVPGHQRQ